MLYVTTLELAKQSADSHADAEELRYLQEAASLKPGDPEPHERLVSLYTRTGRPEQAADERKKAEQLVKAPKN
jgi:Flp pilus assembly protein TadD